jgi:hypothetical protein
MPPEVENMEISKDPVLQMLRDRIDHGQGQRLLGRGGKLGV